LKKLLFSINANKNLVFELKLNTGGPNIAKSFLPKNFGDIGKFGDNGTFGDIETEITILFKNKKNA
jgi:hypothetical protein